MKKPCRPADICAHLGDDYDRYLGAIVPPLFQNTLFTRKHEEHGYSYSRINNPTIEILEKKLAALEHAPAARVFASGMAAITATLSSLLHSGGHVLALRSAYHPVIGFLDTEMKKYGVEVTYLERFTPEEIERSLRPNTRVFYLESPSSNIFRVLPLREIAAQAHACGAVTVIDNTWATPLYQKPLELGIDYSIHSATYSFPSGHTQNAVGTLGGIARWHKNRALRIVCIVLAALTAFSRMYLGVHTPLDVSVAAVTAVVLIFVIYPIVRSAAEDPKKMAVLLGVMTVVALAYVIYANFARFPADVDPDNLFEGRKNSCSLLGALLGFCVGYTLERKYIRFETKAVWWAQVLKVLGGAALLLAVKQGLKLLFAAVGFTWIGTHAIRYFFVVLLAATVWPLTFRWFARLGRKQA